MQLDENWRESLSPGSLIAQARLCRFISICTPMCGSHRLFHAERDYFRECVDSPRFLGIAHARRQIKYTTISAMSILSMQKAFPWVTLLAPDSIPSWPSLSTATDARAAETRVNAATPSSRL